MEKRFLNFDGLRGIAVLLVVLHHYFYTYHVIDHSISINQYCLSLIKYGALGVQLFFIISGFVIAYTLTRYQDVTAFAIARFSRLYPVYWCSILLLFLLSFVGGPSHDSHLYLKSLTMLPGLLGREHLVGIYWTLEFEVIFYIIAAVLYQNNLFSKHSVFVVWLFLALLWEQFYQYPFFEEYKSIATICRLSLMYAPFFIFGIYLHKVMMHGWTKVCGMLLLASALIAIYSCHAASASHYTLSSVRLWCGGFFLISVYAILFANSKIFANRPLRFCGKISYSWYLTHFVAGYLLLNHLEMYLPPLMSIIIAFLASFMLAYVFYFYLETPLQRVTQSKLMSVFRAPKLTPLESKI